MPGISARNIWICAAGKYGFGNSRFHVGANLYFMDYSNQLILTGKISEIGEALTSNIKDSYRMGIELTGGVEIARWLDWSVPQLMGQFIG